MKEVEYPKFRWYVLMATIVASLGQGMILIAPSPLVGQIAKTLQLDLGAATAAVMLPFTLFVAIGGIVGGMVLDKLGIAKTFIASCFIVLVCSILIPVLGDNVLGIALLRAIQGFVFGPVAVSGPRMAAEWFPKKERGFVQGTQGASLSLGITIGLISGPAIAAGSGWQSALAWFGVSMLIGVIMFIIYAFGPKSPLSMGGAETGHAGAVDFKMVFKLPVFWLTLLSVFALSWVMQGYNDLTPGHLAVPSPIGLGLGEQTAGTIMGMYTFAFMFGSLVSSFVAEKIFNGKYKLAVTVTFFLTAIFCAAVTLPVVSSNIVTLKICLILAGFFMGMPLATCMTFISNNYPEQITGSVGGMTMGLGIFGGTVGVAAGSFALHATGKYTVSMLIVIAVAIIGGFCGLGINAPKIFEKKVSKSYDC
jgi:MFS family permease